MPSAHILLGALRVSVYPAEFKYSQLIEFKDTIASFQKNKKRLTFHSIHHIE